MNAHDYLSDDGQALLALCSAFGLPDNAEAEGLSPFKLAEWNQLAKKIAACSLKRPAALHGRAASELARELAVPPDEAERIVRLLDRASRQALELESLFSQGMWVVTRADERYPAKLRDTLKHQAPTVLFGAGEIHLLRRAGVAVIGSRNIDEAGAAFAKEVGRKAVAAKLAVVSGGARGTDRLAMDGALEADGIALGVLADSLEATIRKSDVRQLLLDERLALMTPYAPTAGFSVGAAMGRNKLVYGLAEFAVVVSSDHQTGGTWAGAVEALKANWCPVLARDGDGVPRGNRELLKLGAMALPADQLPEISDLADWVQHHAQAMPAEAELFDFALRDKPR
ncbi:MAG: DNA-protecting protein DprA [Verrucomicrobia bacterium]|nr:DNA-protecting protein DprA [Verrucomicrobiota bacterium]